MIVNLQPWAIKNLEQFDPSSVTLVSLCVTERTVSIVLNCAERKHVVLLFTRVVAHRRTIEEALQKFWADFHSRVPNPHGAFWIADPVNWIQDLSPDHWDSRKLAKHHVVMTDESVIEVISEREPVVALQDV